MPCESGTDLAVTLKRRGLMRSTVLIRSSVMVFGLAALGVASVQALHLSLAIPVQHLRIAWSLTSVLLQL